MQDPRITEPQSTRICHFCLQHVLSGQSSGPHHNTLGKIKEAVADKCIFCQAIYKGVGNMIEDVMPLYDWNVRPAGRSSEGLSTIAIVFRPHTHSGASKIPKGIRTFYMYPEKDLGDILSVSSATTSTDPYHSNGSQISNWLQTCNFTHAGCRKPVPGDFVPTRLLELQNNNHGFVKLVLRGEDYDQGPYCTLSHTWGPPPTTFLNTTNENLETHRKQGIEISSLPNNFRHAIDVARFIGMRYIWIDSLCIIQKDGGADFAFEGQLMHKVYRYSYCNIAAADSADSSGGLFRARDPLDIVPPRFQSNSSSIFGKQTWRVISEDLWDTELLGTSIYKRGWVFQERMLSPRLLHFARDQIFWDCGTISACETVPSNIPYPVDRIATTDRHWRGRLQHRLRDEQAPVVGANDDSIESFWQTAVFNYTSCNLTMQKDKTVAIWSIAKLVRDMTGEKYACGFWSRKLEEQLAWRVADVGQSTRLAELQWWNPSWSWSSVKATILAQDRVVPWRYHTVKDHQGQTI
ncbi:HET-domain-containing protein, partial [Polyplosphaeria fusca]